MRARELAVRIFDWRDLALAVNLTDRGAARRAREDTATSLASNDVGGLLAFLERALLHHGTTGRHNAGLVHDAGHGPQHGSTATAWGSRGDGLRVGHGLGSLRHAERVGRWV